MPANTQPIFSKTADTQWSQAPITAANTAKDGTGTVSTVFSADATNGGVLKGCMVRPLGTNVATVIRFFQNNGGVNTTASNNSLIGEMTIPATTLSEVAAQPDFFWSYIGQALPIGHKINCVIGTAVAAGLQVTAFGGKF